MEEFFEYLNNFHNTIKFTFNFSKERIDFLDTTIYINKSHKRLCSTIYRKPTDRYSLLHYNSYHPPHTKTSIIHSQAIRYRTIITNNKNLKSQLRELKKVLNHRGYPSNIINTEFNKIKHTTQKQLLFEKKKTKISFNYKTNKTTSEKQQ